MTYGNYANDSYGLRITCKLFEKYSMKYIIWKNNNKKYTEKPDGK